MNWLDKNQERILFFTWCFILLVCLFIMFTSPVKAAAPDYSLPYHVEDRLIADLNTFKENYISVCERDGIFPIGVDWEASGVIASWSLNDGLNGTTYICVPEDDGYYTVSLSAPYSSFDIHNDSITITFYNYAEFIFGTSSSIQPEFSGMAHFDETFSITYLGSYQSVDFISSNFYDNDDNVIFTLDSGELPDLSGHATPPINDTGHFIPNVNPQHPSIIPYNPNSPSFPTIDTSTIEKLLESLIDVVEYGFSYIGGLIGGWFSNLLSNLDNWFDYIIQSFSQGFNNVVGSIQDLATDFYNNMVSLFEPISSAISYISQPISGTVIYDNLSNTGIITNYNSIVSTVTGFQDGFNNLSEPSEFKIPIHLENLPSSMFGTLTTQYIDLSVINPVKSIIRAFLWALITYSLFVTIIDSIANYINGGGDE